MDIYKLDPSSIDAIAYKAAKIVVSELKRCEEPQLEMVPVSVAAKILGISEDHMRRIKDKFPHIDKYGGSIGSSTTRENYGGGTTTTYYDAYGNNIGSSNNW